MSSAINPILVSVIRKSHIESYHRGAVVVVNALGEQVFALGDINAKTYPRSSLKLFQTIPLLATGAADKYQLSDKQIALACASHSAESVHIDVVTDWLGSLDLNETHLECGASLSMEQSVFETQLIRGDRADRIKHICSGKHAGMLTLSKFLDFQTRGYSEYAHGSQKAWMTSLSKLLGEDVFSMDWEKDGCGLPAVHMKLERLAYGYAQFANDQFEDDKMKKAMGRIIRAIRLHPEMIAGSQRCCTAVIKKTAGEVIVKMGAEGVYGGVIPSLGLGFALKIDDGATRASEVALGGLLGYLGVLSEESKQALKPFFNPDIFNSQGNLTGSIQPSHLFKK